MARKKLRELLITVAREVEIAETRYQKSKEASDAMQKTARTSWSGAGDREYAQGQKKINKENLDTFISLQKELEGAPEQPPETVQSPCIITFEKEGDRHEIFLVTNVTNIKGFKLVSANSPLGKKLLGKGIGDSFKYGPDKLPTEIIKLG